MAKKIRNVEEQEEQLQQPEQLTQEDQTQQLEQLTQEKQTQQPEQPAQEKQTQQPEQPAQTKPSEYKIECCNPINESFGGVSFRDGTAYTNNSFTASWFRNKAGYTVSEVEKE